MKRTIALGLALSGFAFAHAQNKAVIDAKIAGLPADSLVFYRSMGSDTKDSVKTVSGGFHIEVPVKPGEGDIYMVQIGKAPKEDGMQLLYVDRGTLTITGNGPFFKDAKLSGSKYVADYNDFRSSMDRDPVLARQREIYAKANELYGKGDTAALTAMQPEFDAIDSARTALSKKWIAAHPSSPISAYAIYMNLRNALTTDQLDSTLATLTPAAKNNLPAKKLINSVEVSRATAIGKPAKDFTQADTLGKPVALKDFRGKYVLVDFWASWCHPCRMENPNVVAAFNKYKGKNFTVLGVSLDQKGQKEKWMKAIHDDNLTWTHVSDLNFWNNAVAKLYDIRSIPSNLLIDPKGLIVAKDLHGEELDKKLSELLSN